MEIAVAIIAHHPTDPSTRDNASTTRKAVSGAVSGPPTDRGRYI
jgi:hypothetical protein